MDIKKILTGVIMALMLSASAAMAEGEIREFDVKPDFANNTITVSGETTANDHVTIMVLDNGAAPGNVWDNMNKEAAAVTIGSATMPAEKANADGVIFHIDDSIVSDSDGRFRYEFTLRKNGIYDIYLYTSSGMKQYQDLDFANSDSYNAAIDKLNAALQNGDKDGFVSLLTDNGVRTVLGMSESFGSTADAGLAAEIMYKSIGRRTLAYEYENNKALYDCCAAVTAVKKGYNAVRYLRYAIEEAPDTCEWFDKYIDSAEAERFVADKLKNSAISDLSELRSELEKAIVLYVVYEPNGYQNIQKIFNDFKNITGISNPTTKLTVYSSLAGGSFSDIKALVQRYNELLSKTQSEGSGGGGGGGGGGGASSGSPSGGASLGLNAGTAISQSKEAMAAPQAMNMNIFTDLDSVPWAEDAIVELAVKGVISGKTDTEFYPDDYITREEFTKLVAEAFARDAAPVDIGFADVPESRWSYPYIVKARSAGLINGYSETEFGAEDLISRQDMATIIYNAAIYKNVALGDAESTLKFGDDNAIADYAREAVYVLRSMGIINGVSDVEFAPARNAKRAEAAVMIYALLLK